MRATLGLQEMSYSGQWVFLQLRYYAQTALNCALASIQLEIVDRMYSLRFQPRSQYRIKIRATTRHYRTSILHPVTGFIHIGLIWLHLKFAINYQCHIFICILNDIISCTLTNLYPARKLFNWCAPTGKLINSLITLCLKIGSQGDKSIIITVVMGMAI